MGLIGIHRPPKKRLIGPLGIPRDFTMGTIGTQGILTDPKRGMIGAVGIGIPRDSKKGIIFPRGSKKGFPRDFRDCSRDPSGFQRDCPQEAFKAVCQIREIPWTMTWLGIAYWIQSAAIPFWNP